MSIAAAQRRWSSSPSPTQASSPTCFERSDPMEFEPPPVKGLNFRFAPYPRHPAPNPAHKHPFAILAQSRGPCTEVSGCRVDPSMAMQIFKHGLRQLSDDVLRAAIIEKHVLTERSRVQLLLATWDLEATKQKIHTLERIQSDLEAVHQLSESEYKFFMEMYTDRGLPELRMDESVYLSGLSSAASQADQDATELSVMVEHGKERRLDVNTCNNQSDDEGMGSNGCRGVHITDGGVHGD